MRKMGLIICFRTPATTTVLDRRTFYHCFEVIPNLWKILEFTKWQQQQHTKKDTKIFFFSKANDVTYFTQIFHLCLFSSRARAHTYYIKLGIVKWLHYVKSIPHVFSFQFSSLHCPAECRFTSRENTIGHDGSKFIKFFKCHMIFLW